MSGDIEKLLKGSDHQSEYPKDLYTATKAEFTTNVKMNQPKDGCRKQGAMMLLLLQLITIIVMIS